MITSWSIQSDFSLLIREVYKKKNPNQLNMYLNTLYHEFSVIAVTETWATVDNAP